MSAGAFIQLDPKKITTQSEGARVLLDRWWLTFNGKPLAWSRGQLLTPQCNQDKRVLDHAIKTRGEGFGVLFTPVSYWRETDHV